MSPPARIPANEVASRIAPRPIVDLADTVTDMALVKHHYHQGVPAQRGIED